MNTKDELQKALTEWEQEVLDALLRKYPERQASFQTSAGIPGTRL